MLCGLLLISSPAFAQEPAKSFDWKPVAAAAALQSFDTFSTTRFLSNGSGCIEANNRYWGYDHFTPADPDVTKMWRDKAIVIGAVAVAAWATHRIAQRAPGTRTARTFTWIGRGLGYAAAARGGVSAVRNVALCGW